MIPKCKICGNRIPDEFNWDYYPNISPFINGYCSDKCRENSEDYKLERETVQEFYQRLSKEDKETFAWITDVLGKRFTNDEMWEWIDEKENK